MNQNGCSLPPLEVGQPPTRPSRRDEHDLDPIEHHASGAARGVERQQSRSPARTVDRLLLMGDILRTAKKADEALSWLEKDLAVSARLVEAAPDNLLWRHDLATSLERLGLVLTDLGRRDAAHEAYVKRSTSVRILSNAPPSGQSGSATPPPPWYATESC